MPILSNKPRILNTFTYMLSEVFIIVSSCSSSYWQSIYTVASFVMIHQMLGYDLDSQTITRRGRQDVSYTDVAYISKCDSKHLKSSCYL